MFEEILRDQLQNLSGRTAVAAFVINILLSAIGCSLLGMLYNALGSSTSNRGRFARNFVMLGVTTTLIVTVIKSSIALSLGLVGALSIIRFRSAIKDPEELAYLFACIAVGLGCGAGQLLITASGFCVLAILIYAQARRKRGEVSIERSVLLNVGSGDPGNAGVENFAEVLKKHCAEVNLRRFEEELERVEAVFVLPGVDFDAVVKSKKELLALSESVHVSVLDNEGIF